MNKRVIELVRVSTESQAGEDRAGIPAQRSANQRTAAQHGLQIIRTIQLSDVSGAAVLRTPEMQDLLQLIESPEIHGVVTKEFSRLMRPENFSDYALLQAFVDTKTILYLPDGPIDLGSKSGRLMGTIRAAIAGLERTEILERSWLARKRSDEPASTRRAELRSRLELISAKNGDGFTSRKRKRLRKPSACSFRETRTISQWAGRSASLLSASE
jgi:DNA invertase Pin-like site-specific DNA recombinase